MTFEAEQRKGKREFQLRMMSMLLGGPISSLFFQSPHPTYNDYEELDDCDIFFRAINAI